MEEKNLKKENGRAMLKILLLIFIASSIFIIVVLGMTGISEKNIPENEKKSKNNSTQVNKLQENSNNLARTIIIDGFKFTVPDDVDGRLDGNLLILENEDFTVRMALKISDKSYEECMENPESLMAPLKKAGYKITKELTEITMNGITCVYCTGTMDNENTLFAYAKGNRSKKIVTQVIVEKAYEKEALDIFTRVVFTANETLESNSVKEKLDSISNNTDSKKSTVIEYDVTYSKEIDSLEQATYEIQQEADRQRKKYNNPSIKKIEAEMEKKYDILAVNLGEMDSKTANAVNEAFNYAYKHFPKLKGTLTNVTLANLTDLEFSANALVDDIMFISAPKSAEYPKVMKHQVLLSARVFLNPTRMKNTIDFCIENGYWNKDSSVESIIVHELCHVVIDIIKANRYGIDDMVYITEADSEKYKKYLLEDYADNQTTAKEIVTRAYERSGKQVTLDEFLNSISGYAAVKSNKSGIYRYEETCAEAYADYYLHGEKCSKASRLVLEELIKSYNKYCN